MAVELKSASFEEGGVIPAKHAGGGGDLSPPLSWSGEPERTESCVLICDDPDAPVGTFVHWVVYDIPSGAGKLEEGLPRGAEIPGGAKQGKNDFGKLGYGGPHPPPGREHRYSFRLYCLDKQLGLEPGLSKSEVLDLMQGHIIEQAELAGTYGR